MVSKIFSLLGSVLLAAALILWGYFQWEDYRAGKQSSQHLAALVEQIPSPDEGALMLDIPELEKTEAPIDVQMKEVTIYGHAYIGYLEIPSLKLELPVMSEWSYAKLDVAPCRYFGTMKGKDLVLMAHNFYQHFGKINTLEIGSEITFSDMDGTVYRYKVAAHEILKPSATEEMIASGYPLTLFTCTTDSKSRVVVRCEMA